MTINYNASNSLNLSSLFIERLLYDITFLSPNSTTIYNPDMTGIKNYWSFENLLYGKVDKKLTVISPLKNQLVAIPQDGDNKYVLSEVAIAYKSFRDDFNLKSRYGMLSDDNYLQKPKIFKAFEDVDVGYNLHLTNIIHNFNKKIFAEEKNNEMQNIKQYSNSLISNFLVDPEYSFFSRTAYYLSNKVSSLSSGMSIEIADLNPADDTEKQEFLDSDNFFFYKKAAINAGLLIDKNIPWKLNFDLSSPVNATRLPTAPAGVDVVSSYLNNNFSKTFRQDIDYLFSAILTGYNSFVDSSPYYKVGICNYPRKKIGKEELLENNLKMPYWIKKYIQIRNKETGNPYRESEIEKIIFNAIDLPDYLGLRYINEKFRMPFLQEGSTTRDLLKKELLEKVDFPLDNFSEYVKMIIQESINEIY
tara:strand:- start:566 stop:1819 length:1254 start_codon:yes stop_codon:yes gene_type:complete